MSETASPLPSEADAAAMTLLSVHADQGPFEKLSNKFNCNKAGWFGVAYASPIAVYLLKKTRDTNTNFGGGLVGAMLSAALSSNDALSTCTAADLPSQIRALMDRKGKLAKKDVIIVPKATVSFVKSRGSTVAITAGADTFKISRGILGIGSRGKTFSRLGWQLNTALTPTVAPVHDTRPQEERVTKQKPLWLKILLVIGAIGIIALIIAIKVAADMHNGG